MHRYRKFIMALLGHHSSLLVFNGTSRNINDQILFVILIVFKIGSAKIPYLQGGLTYLLKLQAIL